METKFIGFYQIKFSHKRGLGGPDAAAEDAGRYGGGHYGIGLRTVRWRTVRGYGGAFQKGVDATAEPPDTHITMDATADIRWFPCSIDYKA